MSARMPLEKVATSTYERELYALRQALDHWKHYLLGRHFKLYSDHETLRWLKTQAKMTPKLTRWAAELDQYDFELKPVKGKYNVVVDALSRRADYFGAIVYYLDIGRDLQQKVREAYAEDPIYSDLLKRVREAPEFEPDYRTTDGLLFEKTNVVDRLCVPNSEEIRSLILGECHDTEGHFGWQKTLANLMRAYIWPGMKADFIEYVRSCKVCLRNKTTTRTPLGLLRPLRISDRTGDSVSNDFMDTQTSEVMVIVDRPSKYAVVVPLPAEARTDLVVEKFFDHWVSEHGIPLLIVSDRDTRFTSQNWQELMKVYGSKLLMSSGRHPETNGQTEQMNKLLQQVLRMYIRPDQINWDEMLTKVASAYNNIVHLSTCRTPNELHKSFRPRRPFEGLNRDQIQRLPPGTREFTIQHEKAIATVVDNLRKAQHRMIEQANKHRPPSQFQVGDLVWVKSKEFAPEETISQKLLPAYRGPWPVLEVNCGEDGLSYTVEIPAHLDTYPVFHASKLLPCVTSQQFPSRRSMIPPDMEVEVVHKSSMNMGSSKAGMVGSKAGMGGSKAGMRGSKAGMSGSKAGRGGFKAGARGSMVGMGDSDGEMEIKLVPKYLESLLGSERGRDLRIDVHPWKPWVLFTHDGRTVQIWNYENRTLVAFWRVRKGHDAREAKFIAQKDWIVVRHSQGFVVYEIDASDLPRITAGTESYEREALDFPIVAAQDTPFVNKMAVHHSLPYILTGCASISLWNWEREWELTTFRGHTQPVTDVTCHPTDSFVLASASYDGTVKVWDMESKSVMRTLQGDGMKRANAVQFCTGQEKKLLVSTTNCLEPFARVWDYESGVCVAKLQGSGIAFSFFHPHLPYIFTAAKSGEVKLWRESNYELVSSHYPRTSTAHGSVVGITPCKSSNMLILGLRGRFSVVEIQVAANESMRKEGQRQRPGEECVSTKDVLIETPFSVIDGPPGGVLGKNGMGEMGNLVGDAKLKIKMEEEIHVHTPLSSAIDEPGLVLGNNNMEELENQAVSVKIESEREMELTMIDMEQLQCRRPVDGFKAGCRQNDVERLQAKRIQQLEEEVFTVIDMEQLQCRRPLDGLRAEYRQNDVESIQAKRVGQLDEEVLTVIDVEQLQCKRPLDSLREEYYQNHVESAQAKRVRQLEEEVLTLKEEREEVGRELDKFKVMNQQLQVALLKEVAKQMRSDESSAARLTKPAEVARRIRSDESTATRLAKPVQQLKEIELKWKKAHDYLKGEYQIKERIQAKLVQELKDKVQNLMADRQAVGRELENFKVRSGKWEQIARKEVDERQVSTESKPRLSKRVQELKDDNVRNALADREAVEKKDLENCNRMNGKQQRIKQPKGKDVNERHISSGSRPRLTKRALELEAEKERQVGARKRLKLRIRELE
ncbi:hypothetical protein CBR_g12869 [Chara braunii]|uniref:Integrase catalytic domain-containing protein n=1 Tax=Chara braunii TaxID=69332 RepID=A0A388KSV6_CHABU|nr:hypothetical protein CBR_g12869 [Chara braunii]|eukprot:GBG73151.1 hypothetical protein CBR_g12869 [Chara braunii]